MALFLLLGGCGERPRAGEGKEILAQVNGEPLLAREVEKRMALLELAYGRKLSARDYWENRGAVVDFLLEEKMLLQEARRRGIRPSPEEVRIWEERMREEMARRHFGGSLASLDKNLAARGLSPADVLNYARDQVTLDLLWRRITDPVQVAPEEVRDYFDRNPQEFRVPERVRLREIRTDTREEAERALAEVRAGKDFAEVARIRHRDPLARLRGGEVGYVSKGSREVPEEIQRVAFALRPGEVSGVVQSHFGFHVLKVEEKVAEKVYSFEEVRGGLEAELLRRKKEEAFNRFLADLRRRSEVVREE